MTEQAIAAVRDKFNMVEETVKRLIGAHREEMVAVSESLRAESVVLESLGLLGDEIAGLTCEPGPSTDER